MNNTNKLSDEQTKQVSGGAGDFEGVACPACGSKNLKEIMKTRTKSGIILLSYHCLDCDNGFLVKNNM